VAGHGNAGIKKKQQKEVKMVDTTKESIKKGVQSVIINLYEENGHIAPSQLIEAARPKRSPAHKAFEWDDKKAGSEYRLIQARQWIRRVEIIIDEKPERFVHVPLIVTEDETASEGYYKPTSVVVCDEDEYIRALAQLRARLNSAKLSLDELKHAMAGKDQEEIDFVKADNGFAIIDAAITGGNMPEPEDLHA
jgi:hypothetical protein